MKKFAMNVATLFVTFLSLALVARGQAPAGAVVSPPVFPEFLPANKAQAYDWAVTNLQWYHYGDPLVQDVSWTITYKLKDGTQPPPAGASSTSYRFSSWEHFLDVARKIGMDLVNQVRTAGFADMDSDAILEVNRGYGDLVKRKGRTGVLFRINLGKLSAVTKESFYNEPYYFFFQVVVRIDGLESFEISKNDTAWLSRPANEYIILSMDDVNSNQSEKVRYRITVRGVEREYTQFGFAINPPKVSIANKQSVTLFKTPGSRTVVEYKNMLDGDWIKLKEFQWNDSDSRKEVIVYPPDVTSPQSLRFFRAYSE